MRIGVCTDIYNLEKAAEIGFDYLEWSVISAVNMSAASFSETEKMVRRSTTKVEAANCFFPPEIHLTLAESELNPITEYVKKALYRLSCLGVQVAVVGSAAARNIPEGTSLIDAMNYLCHALSVTGAQAKQYGITIAIEPLNRMESNIINTVSQGYELVKRISMDNVCLLADFYHMRLEGDPFSSIDMAASSLAHVHIANSDGRVFPLHLDEDLYEPFFNTLKGIGYDGRISIEAGTQNFERDCVASLKLLSALIAR